MIVSLRVSKAEEVMGLDVSLHEESVHASVEDGQTPAQRRKSLKVSEAYVLRTCTVHSHALVSTRSTRAHFHCPTAYFHNKLP